MNKLKVVLALTLGLGAALALVHAQGTPIRGIDTTPGQAVFNASCMACHQVTGDGIPAAFPPLRGHVPELLDAEGGREYLITVVLFGLSGQITVAGQAYDGMMPAWGHLRDSQLADVINYVATAWDNSLLLPTDFIAFTAEEVLHARGNAMDFAGVRTAREALELE